MIKKSILATLLLLSLVHANIPMDNEPTASVLSKMQNTDNTELKAWKPTIAKKKAGKSCDDGNCISDLDCFTKDGVMYKAATSVRDKIKKLCTKL